MEREREIVGIALAFGVSVEFEFQLCHLFDCH